MNSGTAAVNSRTAAVNSGTAAVNRGTEAVNSGTAAVPDIPPGRRIGTERPNAMGVCLSVVR